MSKPEPESIGRPFAEIDELRRVTRELREQYDAQARMKEVLRESLERYRSLFDRSPVSLWEEDVSDAKRRIDRLKRDGVIDFAAYFREHPGVAVECARLSRVVDVNQATLDLFGVPDRETLLRNLDRFIGDAAPSLFRFSPNVLCIALNEPRCSGEFEACTMAGKPLVLRFVWSVAPGHEETYDRVYYSLLDITRLKEAESALRDSETRFRELAEFLPEILMEVDLSGRITFANRSAVDQTGYSKEELGRMMPTDLVIPADRERVMRNFKRRLAGESFPPEEYTGLRRDGTQAPILIHNAPIVRDGRPVGLRGVMIDLTERTRAEAERLKLEQRVQQAQKTESMAILAGGIAHDFNNLLASILGNLDLARLDISASSPAAGYMQNVERAAQRAAELCRELLAYSGRGRFVVEPADLSTLVREMGRLLEVSISKQAVLRYALAEGLDPVVVDATQIRQIVMNLITNASESLGGGPGEIAIATGVLECSQEYIAESLGGEALPAGRYAYFEVSDTGCGMSAETCRRIFDPFFTTKVTGRGLGLAAVLGIVRGHRGAVRVTTAPGQGAAFRVLLPVGRPPEPAVAVAPAAPSAGTVLVVDDEEAVRVVVGRMLEKAGFRSLLAVSGAQAVEIFRARSGEVSCVLLDFTMPGMDGAETFQHLAEIRPDVRILLASGYSEQEVLPLFAGRRLAAFIQKPYQMNALIQKVVDVIGGTPSAPKEERA